MPFSQLPPNNTVEFLIITVVITVLLTLLVTKFFDKALAPVLAFVFKPVILIKNSIYKRIAPKNPLSISLKNYKRHVLRSKISKIENPLGPSDISIPLEKAFAPLKLISEKKKQEIDLFDHLSANNRTIILGGAGTGKTTLMKSLVLNTLTKGTGTKLDKLIPVFIKLRTLSAKNYSVEEAIIATFNDYRFPGAGNFVNSEIDQGKLIIILDGLDEVGANRQNVAEAIQNFCERDDISRRNNKIIVTCREFSYKTRDLHSHIKNIVGIEPFSNFHMRKFLEGWPEHKEMKAVNLYSKIQSDPRIVEVCKNPLLLTILTGLYLETGAGDFKIPANRASFYQAAIDELLVQRPARKNQTQNFLPELKIKLLAKISLDRLESLNSDDDPEQIDSKIICRHVFSTFREKEQTDVNALIKEMLEINGILKSSNEDTYNFAHRTFQEYLAAKEALRTRDNKQILEHFGAKPELAEVLIFYCSLNTNLPQLSELLTHFKTSNEWKRAGQCLMNMVEVPDESLIREICEHLYENICNSDDYDTELEILSSIAQIHGDTIDGAGELFTSAIDEIIKKAGAEEKVSLETVLGTKPELALSIIPGLRAHKSSDIRRAGVRILRDIGTDEALDQLFKILNGPQCPERVEAAIMIASLISSSKDDILKRQDFLKKRIDKNIWPIEKYFPGRVAIPIIEALAAEPNPLKTDDPAVNSAVQAFMEKDETKKEKRHWQNLGRDILLSQVRCYCGAALQYTMLVCIVLLFSIVLIISTLGMINNKYMLEFSKKIFPV